MFRRETLVVCSGYPGAGGDEREGPGADLCRELPLQGQERDDQTAPEGLGFRRDMGPGHGE